jgi:hypothetical protein
MGNVKMRSMGGRKRSRKASKAHEAEREPGIWTRSLPSIGHRLPRPDRQLPVE